MAVLTERVSVTLPSDLVTLVRERAKREGISLSAVMRDVVEKLIAGHDLDAALAQLEQRDATIR